MVGCKVILPSAFMWNTADDISGHRPSRKGCTCTHSELHSTLCRLQCVFVCVCYREAVPAAASVLCMCGTHTNIQIAHLLSV